MTRQVEYADLEIHIHPKRDDRYAVDLKVNGQSRFQPGELDDDSFSDTRLRRVPIIANAQTKAITVKGFDDASRVGKFHNTVGQFIRNPDPIILKPFEGKGVTDANGQFHLFETDPNTLIRYALKDEPEFHEIYQIIQN